MSRLHAAPERFRIGELATRGEVSRDAIRFYEREGLLPRPRRTPSRHRVYDQRAVEHLRFIRRCQELGLSLADIRSLHPVRDGSDAAACRRLAETLGARLQAYEERIEAFETYRRRLQQALRRCRVDGSGTCELLTDLTRDGC